MQTICYVGVTIMSMIRLTCVINKVNGGNPAECLEEIQNLLSELPGAGGDIIVLPKLSLCGAGCGSLFKNPVLSDRCEKALGVLRDRTVGRGGYLIVGLVMDDWGRPVSAMAVIHNGELVALIPTLDNPEPLINTGYTDLFMTHEAVFSCGSLRFCILGCDLSTLALQASRAAASGVDLIIIPACSPIRAGSIGEICEAAKVVSASAGCAVAVVNGGVGDTSSPYLYRGFSVVSECGEQLAMQIADYQSCFCMADLDADIIRARKKVNVAAVPMHSVDPVGQKSGLMRPISRTPFLPKRDPEIYLEELFACQVRSLAARMENTGISRLVIGVSGGVDSTAALLVSVGAVDALELPRESILGVTMPGMGTSDQTYYNALKLLDSLGVERRDIPIRASVQQHFEDIGHSGRADTAYENAQARERTQILMDLGNMVGGMVVGTGDLSEEALGFSTFGGDHLANYNVNACVPKTVLRVMLTHIADVAIFEGLAPIIGEILETPVSPELLPTGEQGEISQKTEDILGPYELHDFFLYYLISYRMRPSKLFHYACIAFAGTYDPEFIRDKLSLFIRRFCAGQFKRACAPDGASITEVNLSGVNFSMPSDFDPSALLQDLGNIVSG